jgi:ABC-2 type transport system permease protein
VNALTVARKELVDSRRSALFWVLAAVVTLYAVPTTVRFPLRVFGEASLERRTTVLLLSASRAVAFAALLVGSLTVVGERESGSLRVLLGSGARRRDVIVGKTLGRGALLAGVVVLGLAPLVAATYYRLGAISVPKAVHVTTLTVLLGLAYFGIAVGFSTALSTRLRAVAASFGAFVLFTEFWERLAVRPAYRLVFGREPMDSELQFALTQRPHFQDYVQVLSPSNAYDSANYFYGTLDWFAVGMLLFWFIAPVVASYAYFRRQDIER